MIKNYLKLAWRILGRRKFFTFISLFGISFTLGILMVIMSFLQSELGANAPISKKDDMLFIETLSLQKVFFDTIVNVDTIYQEGIAVYDSTLDYKRRGAMQWNSDMNNKIAEDFLTDLETVDNYSIYSYGSTHDVYVNGVKLSLGCIYADAHYWEILDFEIIEGRTYDQSDVDLASLVMVITTKVAQDYFGRAQGVIGEFIEIDGKNYKVIGVIKPAGKAMPYVSPQISIPYTTLDAATQDSDYHGFYNVMLLKKSDRSYIQVKENVEAVAKTIPMDYASNTRGYEEVLLDAKAYDEMYAQELYYDEDEHKSYVVMKWILIIVILLFVLLPTLNLINLNVSRIMDRSAEIGVRKAFGAHQGNILSQFIVENLVQTFVGGFIGLLLALGLIKLLNDSGALGEIVLTLQPSFFVYAFIATLLFGFLSGLLPAYRMSKLHIVNALKGIKL